MRLLFTTFPAIGHLNTVLPLARAALRAGHEVAVASGADLAAEITRHGVTAWAAGPTRAEAAALLAGAPHVPDGQGFETDLTAMFLPSAAKRAVDLVPRALQWRPDVVVHEISEPAGAVAAAHTGARHVVHGLGHTPSAATWEALFAPGLARLCAEWDVPELGRDILEQAVYLDVFPPTLHTEPPAWRRVRPIRPGIGEAAPGESLPAAVDALPHPETIHLTLGTVFFGAADVLRAAIAGLRDLPFNLVVTTGPGTDPAEFGPQPPHVLIAPYLPHALLLGRCSLVVAHGGAGIMLGSLAHGIPQLMLPQGADQFLNADLCVDAGVALALRPGEVSPDTVADAARELLGRYGYGRRAHRVRAEIAAMPEPSQVLDALTGGQ